MAYKFTRNITDTKIKGDVQEPLQTNVQNDLLSDGEDVAIRNKDEYHLLTDNLKTVTSPDELLTVTETGKNSIQLQVKEVELTNGNEDTLTIDKIGLNEYELTVAVQEDIDLPAVQLESLTPETLTIEEVSTNNFTLSVPEQQGELDVGITTDTPETLSIEETSANQFKLNVTSSGSGTSDVTLNSTTPAILSIEETTEGVYDLAVTLPEEKPDMNLTTNTPETVTISENGTNDFNLDVVSGGGSSDPVSITSGTPHMLKVVENSTNDFTLNVVNSGTGGDGESQIFVYSSGEALSVGFDRDIDFPLAEDTELNKFSNLLFYRTVFNISKNPITITFLYTNPSTKSMDIRKDYETLNLPGQALLVVTANHTKNNDNNRISVNIDSKIYEYEVIV